MRLCTISVISGCHPVFPEYRSGLHHRGRADVLRRYHSEEYSRRNHPGFQFVPDLGLSRSTPSRRETAMDRDTVGSPGSISYGRLAFKHVAKQDSLDVPVDWCVSDSQTWMDRLLGEDQQNGAVWGPLHSVSPAFHAADQLHHRASG